jgi:hypothetical protein
MRMQNHYNIALPTNLWGRFSTREALGQLLARFPILRRHI